MYSLYKKIITFNKKHLVLIAVITFIAFALCIFLALWYRSLLSVRISASVLAALLGLSLFFVFCIWFFYKIRGLCRENYINKNIHDFCFQSINNVILLTTFEEECGVNSIFDSFSDFYDFFSQRECYSKLEHDEVFASYFLLFIIIIFIRFDQEFNEKVFEHIFSRESKIVNLVKSMFRIKKKNSTECTHDISSLTNIAQRNSKFRKYLYDILLNMFKIDEDEDILNGTRNLIYDVFNLTYKKSSWYFKKYGHYRAQRFLFRTLCNYSSQSLINNILTELISTDLSSHDFMGMILSNEFFKMEDYECFKACLKKMLSDGNKENYFVDCCKYYFDYVFNIVQKCYRLEEALRFQLNPYVLLLKDGGYHDKSNTKTVKEWMIFFYNSAFSQNDEDNTCVFYYLDDVEYRKACYEKDCCTRCIRYAKAIGEMLCKFINEKQSDNFNLPDDIYYDAEYCTKHSLSLDDELDMHKCSNDNSVTLDESLQLNEEKRRFYDEKCFIDHENTLNLLKKEWNILDKIIILLKYDYESSISQSEAHNKNYDKAIIVALCCIASFAAQVIYEKLDDIINQVEKEDFSEELKCNILKIKNDIFKKNIADKLKKYHFDDFIVQMSCISDEISDCINTMKYDEENSMEELQKCETAAALLSNHINMIEYMNQTISDKIQEVVISYTDRVMTLQSN